MCAAWWAMMVWGVAHAWRAASILAALVGESAVSAAAAAEPAAAEPAAAEPATTVQRLIVVVRSVDGVKIRHVSFRKEQIRHAGIHRC